MRPLHASVRFPPAFIHFVQLSGVLAINALIMIEVEICRHFGMRVLCYVQRTYTMCVMLCTTHIRDTFEVYMYGQVQVPPSKHQLHHSSLYTLQTSPCSDPSFSVFSACSFLPPPSSPDSAFSLSLSLSACRSANKHANQSTNRPTSRPAPRHRAGGSECCPPIPSSRTAVRARSAAFVWRRLRSAPETFSWTVCRNNRTHTQSMARLY